MNPTSRSLRRPSLLAGGVLALALLTGACGGGGASSMDSAGGESAISGGSTADLSAPSEAEPAVPADPAQPAQAEGTAGDTAGDTAGRAAPAGLPVSVAASDVISTGTVELGAADVGAAAASVQEVADRVGGQVTERTSETDDRTDDRSDDRSDEGGGTELVRARLVLRVPAARFSETMADLEDAGPGVVLRGADSTSTDVSTQVIDTDARVQVARRSIDRIAVLLDGAGSIADVVAVEAQLSRREADLASLVQQQTYLADQSSLSTITVSIQRPARDVAPPEDEEAGGFLVGLDAGWDALGGAAAVAATVLGAVLPWLVVVLALGLPGLALARRLGRRTPRASGGVAGGGTA